MALMQKEPELKDISRRRIPRLRLCCWWRFYFWNGRISNFWAVFPKTTIWLHKQDRLFIVLLSILKTFSEKVAITGDFKVEPNLIVIPFWKHPKAHFLFCLPPRIFDLLSHLRQALENVLCRFRFTMLRYRIMHSGLTIVASQDNHYRLYLYLFIDTMNMEILSHIYVYLFLTRVASEKRFLFKKPYKVLN